MAPLPGGILSKAIADTAGQAETETEKLVPGGTAVKVAIMGLVRMLVEDLGNPSNPRARLRAARGATAA